MVAILDSECDENVKIKIMTHLCDRRDLSQNVRLKDFSLSCFSKKLIS